MRRAKLMESYGKRFTPWSNFAGVLLIIAFGIFLALAKTHQEKTTEESPVEQVIE